MRKILRLDEIYELKPDIGEEFYGRLRSSRHICAAPDKFSYLVMFMFTDVRNEQHRDDQVCIYCRESDLVFLSDNSRCLRLIN